MTGLLLAGVVTAGCSSPEPEGSEPAPTETATDVESPEESEPAPGPTPWPEPERPAAMDRDDAEGAQAAAEYFMELYDYIYATGDLDEWRAIAHEDCLFCDAAADHVTELFADGGYTIGDGFTVNEVIVLEPDVDYSWFRVRLIGVEASSQEFSNDGTLLASLPGGPGHYSFALHKDGGRWQVIEGSGEAEVT